MRKGHKYPPEILTPAEVHALIKACSRGSTGVRNQALIAVLWRCGLRISEALALREVDLSGDRVQVLHGKNDRHRIVGIDPDALAYIERWIDRRRQLGINGHRALFCTLEGKPLHSAYVRALFKRLARKAGVDKRAHPHALRHAHAVELLQEGTPLMEIRDQLGHASLDGTAAYLNHIAPEDRVRRIAARRWSV